MDDTFRRGPLLLLAGRANRPLAGEIGEIIGKSPDGATIRQFADGEIFVRIDRNARGRDVFIVQPTDAPAEH
ncbi:MAG: ribose-phosphate pyrophosphokinase-like domain-containing protein, partial [Gemmatimonadetes bacterium]|nr:ribose-phosphate pyrophosphokinase-like domain-containing protein [Gemmatimonadota bacterium]NIT90081.1 ribose-phosphate pyrophosphokinase-like domain-containing protein [Gemmatimonadota bacterium]NIU33893.1 ribose-phosphate pyrophosphokinase-like domain-containing protein [Gemmatimonadota bacterium]NIV64227.1 ribose-phosphate pyrophosphokinase-like domain-containing protein [Gemmatimonadota bacterium]NIW66971.1 ribose-phosphate pyrophosphokinase-like domain-containing protein [Gemmatimonado